MSTIDISGLWCDDITFCQEECDMLECPRNSKNIRDKTIPHSYSVEIPSDCPKRVPDFVEEQIVRHEWHGNTDTITYGQLIVRCKDCKHWRRANGHCPFNSIFTNDDWFCADGERKGEQA